MGDQFTAEKIFDGPALEGIREAGEADKASLRKQKARFAARQKQEQAESFKPVAAPVQAPQKKRLSGGKRQAESLLTRAV